MLDKIFVLLRLFVTVANVLALKTELLSSLCEAQVCPWTIAL